MDKEHHYQLSTKWTGNTGHGTINYKNYERSYIIRCQNKPIIYGTSNMVSRGHPNIHNPEEMLIASLSSSHMLWYLHLCAEAGVVVISYNDKASGTMTENANGRRKFKLVILNPIVEVKSSDMIEMAHQLHAKANELCFIANEVNFPILHRAIIASII